MASNNRLQHYNLAELTDLTSQLHQTTHTHLGFQKFPMEHMLVGVQQNTQQV
jgi:hypothetical protein